MKKGINNTRSVSITVGARIREARENRLKLSRPAFCDLINQSELRPMGNVEKENMNQERLKQWEYGNNPVDLEWIPALCKVLSVDVGFLFGEYEEYSRQASDIAAETGLSQKSIDNLIGNKNSLFGVGNKYIDKVLSSDYFCDEILYSLVSARLIQQEGLTQLAFLKKVDIENLSYEELTDLIEITNERLKNIRLCQYDFSIRCNNLLNSFFELERLSSEIGSKIHELHNRYALLERTVSVNLERKEEQ